MALINCPDCKKQISDSAIKCIHCGRPMRQSNESIWAEIRDEEKSLKEMIGIRNSILHSNRWNDTISSTLKDTQELIPKMEARIRELRAKLTK
jgi:Zn ribbon nucleic-acid-binding protein